MSDETADLRAWKESAMSVLAEWDRVHDALGRPGPLGRSLALNTLAEVERLSAENERLRKSLRELVTKWENIGDDFHGAGCHDTAIGYENAAGDVRRMFADLGLASLSETGGEA